MAVYGGVLRTVLVLTLAVHVVPVDGWTRPLALEHDALETAATTVPTAPSHASDAVTAAAMAADLDISQRDAHARLARQDDVGELARQLEELSAPWFGGVWIDHADSGRVKVGYVGETVPTALLRVPVPASLGGIVEYVPVRHSLSQLRQVQSKIDALHLAPGTMASSLVVDRNLLVISIDGGREADPTSTAAVESAAGDLAAAVDIGDESPGVLVSCSSSADCDSPLRGGISITSSGVCTGGFTAQDSLGTLYLLTANHCDGVVFRHGPTGKEVGTRQYVLPAQTVDAVAIRLSVPWAWSATNWVFGSTPTQWVQSTVATSAIATGHYVCKFGRTTQYTCGSITAVNVTNYGYTNLFRVAACARGGDSGAPVFNATIGRAYGITNISEDAADCDSSPWYHATPIEMIQNQLGVQVLTRPGTTHRPMVKYQTSHLLRDTLTQGSVESSFTFGDPVDQPLYCDWDGNGTKTVGVYRPNNSWFYLRDSNSTGVPNVSSGFGNPGDRPLCGDWDGNGTETIGVWRNGTFYLSNWNVAPTANYQVSFGNPTGDLPVAGDWDRNGTATIGIFRTCACAGRFFLRNSNAAGYCCVDHEFNYGNGNDAPIAGDWDGDGRDTAGVTRVVGTDWMWYLDNENDGDGTDISLGYGSMADAPAAWAG